MDTLAREEGLNIKKEIIEEFDSIEKTIIDYTKTKNIGAIVIGTKGIDRMEEYFLAPSTNLATAVKLNTKSI